MDDLCHLPDVPIADAGPISRAFLDLGILDFQAACRYARALPYGYNSDREDPLILFRERMGTCTTKHAAIATLAAELDQPVHKHLGIYAMTEAIVTGTADILNRYGLPYVPMIHCFLAHGAFRVDLTEGNRNGKNTAIDDFLYTTQVVPAISARDEYRLYRSALTDEILRREELSGVQLKTVLHAREEGLSVLMAHVA